MLCNYVITPKERPKVYFPWYLETKISSEANIFSLFPANFQRFSLKFGENIAWWSGKKLVLGKFFFVSLKSYSLQAGSHLGAHARAEKSEFESEAILREESGDEARRKWACPDLCKIFISASPERSEIPLVEKRERWQNCQSIMFHEKRSDPQGVGNLRRVQQSAQS